MVPPRGTMFDEITKEYPSLFPRDPAFRTAARQHRCPVCTLMKGARTYRKSKRMEKKQKRSSTPPVSAGTASTCPPAPPLRKRVRFAADTKDVSHLHADDFLQAFRGEMGKVLHIDHAHTIAVGLKGERYYLMMVVDGVDFMWATPTHHTSTPELAIEDFL